MKICMGTGWGSLGWGVLIVCGGAGGSQASSLGTGSTITPGVFVLFVLFSGLIAL